MIRARFEEEGSWVKCGKCGHKLFRTQTGEMVCGIEIKCSSCKEVNETNEIWYFTFGCGQEHEGHYVTFTGSFTEARDKMVKQYGVEWAFQYSEREFREAQEDGTWHEVLLR